MLRLRGENTASHETGPRPGWWKVARALDTLGFLICVVSLVAYADRLWWPFELATHFRLQYVVGLLSLAVLNAIARRRRWAVVLGLCCSLNAVEIGPVYWPVERASQPSAARLRVGLLNVNSSNQQTRKVLDALREQDPDIFVVIEVNTRWLEAFEELTERYPHSWSEARSDNFGIAIFSKLPLDDPHSLYIGRTGMPSVIAQVMVAGRPLTILGTHPFPPVGSRGSALRNMHLASIPNVLRGIEGHIVLLGDLNCTPWSSYFRELLEATNLHNSMAGFGVQLTWPTSGPLLLLGIPIDHCLISKGVTILDRQVGPETGSDHLPVFVDLALADEAELGSDR